MSFNSEGMSRRSLLGMIGTVAGAAAMYSAMSTMGLAQPSDWKGRLNLQGDTKGTSVLILGGGLAGMTAAFELRNAGYQVKILEYREKAGGRCWTLRGGDTFTELGGFTQTVEFSEGNYINPGPWRIPSDHFAVLDTASALASSWSLSSRSTTTPICTTRKPLTASRSGSRKSRPTSVAMSPSCWPRWWTRRHLMPM